MSIKRFTKKAFYEIIQKMWEVVEIKMQEEKIDVLMATYNTNIDFLKMQIDSLLNQTYKEINIIISDDASTHEDTKNTLKEYLKKDNRIQVFFNEKNLGYVKNFEFLLEKSKANYIMFCDHDDIWYNNKVDMMYKKIVETKTDLVYCNARQIDKDGKVLQESYIDYKHLPKINGKNCILACSRHIAIGCSQMFTKNIKEQMIPYKKSVIAHDWINMYLATLANGVAYIDEPLFDYRLHEENEFGGRSLNQNLNRWKKQYGNTYKAYSKYRNWAITDTFYNGSKMCDEYVHIDVNDKILNYYEKIIETKVFNIHFLKYFKYLGFNGIKSRALKEIVLFHMPLLGFMKFKLR